MKAHIGGVEYEGTPEELAGLSRALGYAPSHPSLVQGPPTHDPAKDEEILRQYEARAAVTPEEAAGTVRLVRKLKASIAPRSILDATKKDVQDFVEERLAQCRNLYTYQEQTRTPGWHKCKKGHFDRDVGIPQPKIPLLVQGAGVKPATCNKRDCPDYQLNIFVANETLQSLNSFFNYHEDEILKHPVRTLLPLYSATLRVGEHMRERHNPGAQVARRLVLCALDIVGKSLTLLGAKSGRRLGELRLIQWTDVDLEKGWIDLNRVRLKKLLAAGRGKTKMQRYACRYLFLDDETIRVLRDYHAHWYSIVKKDATGTPLTQAMWLGRNRDGVASKSALADWFRQCIVDAGLADVLVGEAHTTFHCLRHFFTTEAQRVWIATLGAVQAARLANAAGPREFVKYLRGDVMGDAMERYEHLPPEELRERYLQHAPQLDLHRSLTPGELGAAVA